MLQDAATGENRFGFLVNGRPIYFRGACWAPIEHMSHCWLPDRAKAASGPGRAGAMNILRVWGEGVEPPAEFYDECDRRGHCRLAGLHVCQRHRAFRRARVRRGSARRNGRHDTPAPQPSEPSCCGWAETRTTWRSILPGRSSRSGTTVPEDHAGSHRAHGSGAVLSPQFAVRGEGSQLAAHRRLARLYDDPILAPILGAPVVVGGAAGQPALAEQHAPVSESRRTLARRLEHGDSQARGARLAAGVAVTTPPAPPPGTAWAPWRGTRIRRRRRS